MTRPRSGRLLLSPINLPEGTSGDISITHKKYPAGSKLPIIGMRQAFHRGVRPCMGILPQDITVHSLGDKNNGTWMTDLPEELFQIYEACHNVRPMGKVLIGGLGLGILAHYVFNSWTFERPTIVEISQDVVNLTGAEHDVVVADIAEYLRNDDPGHDVYMLDTWQATNEGCWWDTIMPLKRIIRNRWGRGPKIWCWAEDIAAGGVIKQLQFAKPHWYYQNLTGFTRTQAEAFVRNVGLPTWEQNYAKRLTEL